MLVMKTQPCVGEQELISYFVFVLGTFHTKSCFSSLFLHQRLPASQALYIGGLFLASFKLGGLHANDRDEGT